MMDKVQWITIFRSIDHDMKIQFSIAQNKQQQDEKKTTKKNNDTKPTCPQNLSNGTNNYHETLHVHL